MAEEEFAEKARCERQMAIGGAVARYHPETPNLTEIIVI